MPPVLRRFALGSAILVFGIWGIILMVKPEIVHPLFTDGPMNLAYAGMMGAALLGLAVISLATETGWLTPSRALGVAVAIIVIEAGFLMFSQSGMLITPVTSISLISALAVAVFLIL
ncbi:MAG TPA: hypothetical protein ENJ35_02585 [Gammaproteobacteria bacterium]|nr:hypothetical protein [Gammaproteobacteria bacterium]